VNPSDYIAAAKARAKGTLNDPSPKLTALEKAFRQKFISESLQEDLTVKEAFDNLDE